MAQPALRLLRGRIESRQEIVIMTDSTTAAAMTNDDERLAAAFAAFDEANGLDPNLETVDGRGEAKELLYGRRMTTWLDRLYPDASMALKLAARCQHLERWTIPRKRYPEGRVGYLTWRRDLKLFHAERAGDILLPLGFPRRPSSGWASCCARSA